MSPKSAYQWHRLWRDGGIAALVSRGPSAPCEAPDGHPLLKDLPRFHVRGPGEKLFEEAYDWARPMTDAECTLRHLVGIDLNMAFAAGANGLVVGFGGPTHVKAPVFNAKLPGSCWWTCPTSTCRG